MRKPLVLIALGLATLVAMGADDCSSVEGTDTPQPTKQANSKPANASNTPAPKPAKPDMTPGQKNAVRSAEDYLDYTAFSKSGLIDQLTKSEGFSKADATFAVNQLNANWKQQAYLSAKDYLDYTSFSLSGLVDQLVQAEGFTQTQADYGANKAYNGG